MEYGRKGASRVLALLEALSAGAGDHLRELETATHIPKSTISRLLADLEAEGWLEREEKSYVPTVRLALLASRLDDSGAMVKWVSPLMSELAQATGKTVLFCTRHGLKGLCLHAEEPPTPVKFVAQAGMEIPLHKSATGKVLAAFAPERVRAELLAQLERDEGPLARETLSLDLEKIARHRSAFSQEEWIPHAADLSVPLFDRRGGMVGQLGLAGLAGTFSDLPQLLTLLTNAARALGDKL